MIFAAISTIIAVFENIICFAMDLTGCSRRKAVICNAVAIILLSLPCVLGYNLWSGFAPLGEGTTVLDLEDFVVSNLLLPLGSLIFIFFCTSRYGWGWKDFTKKPVCSRRPIYFFSSILLPPMCCRYWWP